MRTSTLFAAALVIATFTTVATAADDFSALLADLSFGDAPTLNESLAIAETETVDQLKPAPSGIVMPEIVDATPAAAPVAQVEERAPQVALKDPVPASTPQSLGNVDFDEAFALQDPVPTRSVGHVLHHGSHGCDQGIVCTPRDPVRLPSSTLLQYFRSSVCYTHVWDGYQVKCPHNLKHLNGECDCFKDKGHGCGGCNGNGCTSCDTCD